MVTGPKSHQELAPSVAHPTARRAAMAPEARAAEFRALAGAVTPLEGAAAARHLARAWQAVLGEPVPAHALDLLWAQWALETGHGRAMRGHNFGGVKAARGGALLDTFEGHGAERVRVQCRFRTYRTADDGARDHVTVLARRFPAALEALRGGDGPGFVAALAESGYFTADPAAYRAGIERLAAEHAGKPTEPSARAVPVTALVDGVLASLRHRGDDG